LVPALDIEEIFHAARLKPPCDRAAYLRGVCGDDVDSAALLESLLASDGAAERFLETPAAELIVSGAREFDQSPWIGTSIGNYRILRIIAAGGMGIVYEAEQAAPRRRVALKLLRRGLESATAVRRFRRESELLGRLRHDGIAQVYEAGVHHEDGRPTPFFAMEFLAGAVPLTDYARHKALGVPERIELLCRVCDAVEYCHDQGVIHRDLKPGNMLVTPLGEPKVIDFGVAQARTTGPATQSWHTLGNPLIGSWPYMSPEQVGGNPGAVDAQSDVYALGVITYELLAGRLPLDLAELPPLEAARRIRDEEPLPLGAVDRRLRGDLETITATALTKEKSRRYPSAAALAADLRRFLRHEPIQARRPSAMYRFRKLARRNKAAFAAASAIAGGILLTVTGLAASNIRIRKEKEQKERAFAAARESGQQARSAVDNFFTVVSENDLFDAVGLQPLRKQLLEDALEYYQQFVDQHPDDPKVQAAQAAAHFRTWQIYRLVDQYDDGIAALAKGLDIVEQLQQANDAGVLEILATVRHGGEMLHATWSLRASLEARRTLERGIQIWERLAADNPDIPEFQRNLADTYGEFANHARFHGDEAEALAAAEKSLESWEWLGRHHPALLEGDDELPYRRAGLNVYLRDVGKLHEAESCIVPVLESLERQAAQFPEVRRYSDRSARLQRRLAEILSRDPGRVRDAEQAWRRAIDLFEDLVAANPGLPSYLWLLGNSYVQFGYLLHATGRTAEAERAFSTGLRHYEKLASDFPTSQAYWSDVRESHRGLALLLAAMGRGEEAEKMGRNMIEIFQKRLAECTDPVRRVEHHAELAQAWHNLGELLRILGREESEAAFGQATALYAEILAESPENLDARRALGWSSWERANRLLDARRFEEAITAYQKSLAAAENDPRVQTRFLVAQIHGGLGRTHWQAGRPQDAEPLLRKAIELFEMLGPELPYRMGWSDGSWGIRESRNALVELLKAAGRTTEAEQIARQAVEFYEDRAAAHPTMPEFRAGLGAAQANLAGILRQIDRADEARPLLDEAILLLNEAISLWKELIHEYPHNADYRVRLGHAQWQLGYVRTDTGQPDLAEQAVRGALQTFERAAHDFPDHPFFRQEQGFSRRLIGDMLSKVGRIDEADRHYRAAIDLYAALAVEAPVNAFYHHEEAYTTWMLGGLLERADRLDVAAVEYRRAILLHENAVARFPNEPEFRSRLAAIRENLDSLLVRLGEQVQP
jgi:tetratricopeptide (TPR) repeat protein/tRNA A-37 threonylcarbamoyl transferase component Bud32